jgi:hypothetical protein
VAGIGGNWNVEMQDKYGTWKVTDWDVSREYAEGRVAWVEKHGGRARAVQGNPIEMHENPARRARSNPPGDLTYGHFYRTGGQDCANVISIDEFDLDGGTAEQIVDNATSDWDDDLEREWIGQMNDEDFEGLDPHKAFAQWKAGWRARAVRTIADRLKEREDEEE